MTLEQLRIFVAVADREHLTRAAGALNLSPSAVSTAIRTLEERYGARLFDRVGRGIELTETGRDFLPEAPQPLMRFHAAHPGIALDLTIGNTETVSRAVGEGAADLGFIEGEIDEPALAMRLVAADRLVLLTAPGHPWAQGAAPSAADLAGAQWILR